MVGSADHRVIVFDGHDVLAIPAPVESLRRIAAVPAGRYVLGATQGRVLRWDVEQILPRPRVLARDVNSFAVVGQSGTELVYGTIAAEWFWRRGAEVRALGRYLLPGIGSASASGDWLAITAGSGQVHVFGWDGAHVTLPEARLALVLDDGKLLVGTAAHRVLLVDPAAARSPRGRTVLHEGASEVLTIAHNRRWLVAAFADGTVWRRDRASGAATTVSVPAAANVERGTVVYTHADGRVFLAAGDRLQCWRLDGTVVEHARLPEPITTLTGTGSALGVATRDDAHYVIDLDHPNTTRATTPVGTSHLAFSGVGLASFESSTRLPMILDTVTGWYWPLVRRRSVPLINPVISGDGSVVTVLDGAALVQWRVDVPMAEAATAAWLDRLTNATADLGPGTVSWQ